MERVEDVMTSEPIAVDVRTTVRRAAELMHQHDVGDVLVMKDGELFGILTDRDIVVRALAVGFDLDGSIETICTSERLVVVAPEDPVDKARDRMRKRAVRRIPVVDDGEVVGVLSLGDLAIEREPRSCLGRISAAPPNN
jgi:CBS domain-containing protein